MQKIFLLAGILLFFDFAIALADSPRNALEEMINSDMMGNPTVRINLATSTATSEQLASTTIPHLMTFFVGSSQIVLATNWHIERGAAICLGGCKISVIYRVVAETTRGAGSYSNGKFSEREIVPLKKPICRKVTYEMIEIAGKWKIQHLPLPYVNPNAVAAFYQADIKSMLSIPAPKSQGEIATYRDRMMIMEWEQRQIGILSRLSSK